MSEDPASGHAGWSDPLADLDTRSPDAVRRLLHEAAEANREAPCRAGSVDLVQPAGRLIATGDIHDNPLHLARIAELARFSDPDESQRAHLTLHEVIHSERLLGGMDLSHRALLRVAAMKRADPQRVHTLLANHELSQIVGAGIVKDGVRVVDAFNAGVEQVFGDDAHGVLESINDFIRSMPLALVSRTEDGRGVLCAHSLPSPAMMERFDPAVLERDLVEGDYEPRKGSAHLMVWGRGHTTDQLASLADRWGVSLFLLGHEKAENGWELLQPNAVILNSDHQAGVALPIDLADPPPASEAVWSVVPLAQPQ